HAHNRQADVTLSHGDDLPPSARVSPVLAGGQRPTDTHNGRPSGKENAPMIPSITLDLTTAFEWFGWAGVGFVVAALGGVLVVALIADWRAKPEADAENVATPDALRPAA